MQAPCSHLLCTAHSQIKEGSFFLGGMWKSFFDVFAFRRLLSNFCRTQIRQIDGGENIAVSII